MQDLRECIIHNRGGFDLSKCKIEDVENSPLNILTVIIALKRNLIDLTLLIESDSPLFFFLGLRFTDQISERAWEILQSYDVQWRSILLDEYEDLEYPLDLVIKYHANRILLKMKAKKYSILKIAVKALNLTAFRYGLSLEGIDEAEEYSVTSRIIMALSEQGDEMAQIQLRAMLKSLNPVLSKMHRDILGIVNDPPVYNGLSAMEIDEVSKKNGEYSQVRNTVKRLNLMSGWSVPDEEESVKIIKGLNVTIGSEMNNHKMDCHYALLSMK